MKAKLSIPKEQLISVMGPSLGKGVKLSALRVRTVEGKLLDFEELVFEVEMPVATK